MNRLKRDIKKLNKFQKPYKKIFKNDIKHFDELTCKLFWFTISLVDNDLGFKQTKKWIQLNYQNLIKWFNNFKIDQIDKKAFKNFHAKSFFTLQKTKIPSLNLLTKLVGNRFSTILNKGFVYYIYNDCEIIFYEDLELNILDKDYNEKVSIALVQAELYRSLRDDILKLFKNNVNGLICILIGLSNRMYDLFR